MFYLIQTAWSEYKMPSWRDRQADVYVIHTVELFPAHPLYRAPSGMEGFSLPKRKMKPDKTIRKRRKKPRPEEGWIEVYFSLRIAFQTIFSETSPFRLCIIIYFIVHKDIF